MHATSTLLLAEMALTVLAVPLMQGSVCSSYTIINTRGTGEAPGESIGFSAVNRDLLAQLAGGKRYNTVYSADASQDSKAGTDDIIRYITKTIASSPRECFVLEGYSQGAAATVNALAGLKDAAATAVKAVLLIGNPEHKSGLSCNVDMSGGASTKNVNGMQVAMNHIPEAWVAKTLDVCNYGDGVCDTTHGMGINAQHLAYPNDQGYQAMATRFLAKQLNAGDSANSDSLTPQGSFRPVTTDSDGQTMQQSGGGPAAQSPWFGRFSGSIQSASSAPTVQSAWSQWPSFGKWSRQSIRSPSSSVQTGDDIVSMS